jgi:hypothetical protein
MTRGQGDREKATPLVPVSPCPLARSFELRSITAIAYEPSAAALASLGVAPE